MLTDQKLNEEETWFELSPLQQRYRDQILKTNQMIRNDYHAIHKVLWLSKYVETRLPQRLVKNMDIQHIGN
jgi:hypothetical protein